MKEKTRVSVHEIMLVFNVLVAKECKTLAKGKNKKQ